MAAVLSEPTPAPPGAAGASLAQGPHPVRVRALRPSTAYAAVGVNVAVVVAMWVRHGGPDQVGAPGGWLTAVGQLTGLLGTLAALVQLVLVARAGFVEQAFGMDRLLRWHRWGGFSTAWLLVAHALTITAGYAAADGRSLRGEVVELVRHYPNVLAAAVGLGLLAVVAVTSMQLARRRLAYETWYFVHLYAYLAVALAFAHQLAVGADFVFDPLARAYWVGLYVVTAFLLVGWRVVNPVRSAVRHRLRVGRVVPEGPGVVSVELTGRALERYRGEAGQFVLVRFITRAGWWKAHPYSFSLPPESGRLRLTVKALGDDSANVATVPPGTRVIAEGPYGRFTARARTKPKALLIGGGVGITPLRALFESLPGGPGDVTLLYRASRPDDVLFRAELEDVSRRRGFAVRYAVGRRGDPGFADPFAPDVLRAAVPDLADHDVYLCGPAPMMAAARSGLRAAGVPARQVHYERFDY